MLVGQLSVAALGDGACAARQLTVFALHIEGVLEEVDVVIVAAGAARPDHLQVSVEGLVVLRVRAVQVGLVRVRIRARGTGWLRSRGWGLGCGLGLGSEGSG